MDLLGEKVFVFTDDGRVFHGQLGSICGLGQVLLLSPSHTFATSDTELSQLQVLDWRKTDNISIPIEHIVSFRIYRQSHQPSHQLQETVEEIATAVLTDLKITGTAI